MKRIAVAALAYWAGGLALGFLLGRAAVVDARGAWLVGAGAFILLLTSECVLAAVLFGRLPDQWAADLLLPAGLLGLAGQVLWALLPGWAWRRGAPDRLG